MKLAKRLIAVVIVAVMLASSLCIFASAAMLTYKNSHNVTNDGAVKFTKYSAAGAHTETATVLEFNPKNGYIPVAFVSNPSSLAYVSDQYNTAVNTYGYEVAGAINGGYFTMSTSTLEGMVITDGKLVAASVGSNTVVAFGSDGSMDIVTTQPKYTLGINGKSIDNPIYYFNKDYNDASSTYQSGYMFYYDYSNNAKTSYASGVEVVFEKMENTDLSYGETLIGKVVKKGTSTGTTVAKNQFVLYAKTGSTYASELNSLAVGDKVTLTVTETNAGAVSVMNKANSALSHLDYLVKDGKNYTYEKTNLAGHSVTKVHARWTAYGIKADGTYVFFTSEGGTTSSSDNGRSLTLREVADALVELGCVTAVRLDGGGSTAMYVSNTGAGSAGSVMAGQRKVADCIMIVKKSSMHDSALEAQLKSSIANAKQTSGTNASVLKAIADAEAIVGTGATEGQLRKAITSLSPKSILGQALAQCETLDIGQYAEPDLANIRSVYKAAKAVYNNDSSTDAQYSAQTVKVYDALNKSSNVILSTGASYTTTSPNRGDDHDDDGIRLTDGTKGGLDLSKYSYSGWNVYDISDRTVNVVVDLGTAQMANTFTIYMAAGQWGIQNPAVTLNVYTSTNGTKYDLVATTTASELVGTATVGSETCRTYTYTATLDEDVSARYVKFAIKNSTNFTWLDEVEVSRNQTSKYGTVTNYVKIQSFNTKITAGSSTIFTPSMGALNQANANHTWASNIICEKQSDGSYVVVENVGCHGDSSKVITLKSNQILVSAHSDPTVPGSNVNARTLNAATVGQVLWAYGIDFNTQEVGVAAYVKFLNKGVTNPDLIEKEEPSTPVDPNPPVDPDIPTDPVDPTIMKGDINENGEIDSMDYVLLKRAYFGTYKLDDITVGDLNDSGIIDSMDYVFLKRAYFGTYVIK